MADWFDSPLVLSACIGVHRQRRCQGFCVNGSPLPQLCFPPEPPVALEAEQIGAERARARGFCAAQRTLAGEHQSATAKHSTGGSGGKQSYFPLVSFERV